MSCGSLDGRGSGGRMNTCICMAASLCWPPETITILLIDYTPVQNKELKEKENGIETISMHSVCVFKLFFKNIIGQFF